MNKTEKESGRMLRKMMECHRLPLMILAWFFPLFLVKDMTTGILLGAAGVLVFLILEGSRFFFEKFLPPVLQVISCLIMLVSLTGMSGILLHLVQPESVHVSFYCFVLEQLASVYIMRTLVYGTGEKKEGKSVWRKLLYCFERAAEYMLFLGIVGLLREYAGKWTGAAGLFSGGFLITAGLLFLWKLTKTMPKRFEKLPRMMLSTGLFMLVLAGFAGLL